MSIVAAGEAHEAIRAVSAESGPDRPDAAYRRRPGADRLGRHLRATDRNTSEACLGVFGWVFGWDDGLGRAE